MCACPEGNTTLYVLGDMDLLCNEGECSLIKSEVWDKMAMHEPAGTIEMRPPEVRFACCLANCISCNKLFALVILQDW